MIVSDDDVARCRAGDRSAGRHAGPASRRAVFGAEGWAEGWAESCVGFAVERRHHGRPSGVGAA